MLTGDAGSWLVVVKINGWFKVAVVTETEDDAKHRAEKIALGNIQDTDLDENENMQLLDGVHVYQQQSSVKSETVIQWSKP